MATELTFDPVRLPPECVVLRKEVRAFLAKEMEAGARVDYHELADLSHAYPRDINPAMLRWLIG